MLSFIIATILVLPCQRSRRETSTKIVLWRREVLPFSLSLLVFLRLCYPFIPQFDFLLQFFFFWIYFFFSLILVCSTYQDLYKGKRKGYRQLFSLLILIRKVTVLVIKKKKKEWLSKVKTNCSGIVWNPKERGTFFFLFSHSSFDIVLSLLWL